MRWSGITGSLFIWLALVIALVTAPIREMAGQALSAVQYTLVTDRGVYVAGEQVQFRVFNLNPREIREKGWSTVYYLELVSPEGTSMVRTKWPLDGDGASGSLEVPMDLPSGTYYLKGYTKWMKNSGPAGFLYLSVEIVNPYRVELLRVDTLTESNVELLEYSSCGSTGGQMIQVPELNYTSGELITLELKRPPGSTSLDCSISVVRQGAFGAQKVSAGSVTMQPDAVEILPETDGITLSGSVRRDSSGAPAPFAVVYLSSLGEANEFYATHSDGDGRFYFALADGVGEQEYFISSNLEGRTDLSLRLDQDFSSTPVRLPAYPLSVAVNDPELVTLLAVNAQIREQYQKETVRSEPDSSGDSLWFYGHADETIRFGDYIRLPDLEEYFTEVISAVSLKRSGGTRRFLVHGAHPDMQFFPPLVMVDGVAVFDVESVLDISPRVVDRVEVVSAPYIRGDVTFGGIVHLITRNGNMGYMDLPTSGLLLSYGKFAAGSGRALSALPTGPHIPDVRNTLYWDPAVFLVPGETGAFSFRAPHASGNYEVRITGRGPNGICFGERHIIRVE